MGAPRDIAWRVCPNPQLSHTRREVEDLIGRRVDELSPVPGGLVNTVYRVASSGQLFALRIFSRGPQACERERSLLSRLSGILPVPEVVLGGSTFILTKWIEGRTISEQRRSLAPGALLTLASEGGALAARGALVDDASAPPGAKSDAARFVAESCERLRSGLARERLGAALSDALRERLELTDLPMTKSLVHGDFGGRNILISAEGKIAGLIDWEDAFPGSPLWDLGSFFRYPQRFSEAFRSRFQSAYRGVRDSLPEDWYEAARSLDAARQVVSLDDPRVAPEVVMDILELLPHVARTAQWS